MIRLLYISSATKPMNDDELLELLNECRHSNSKEGITGVMLYCSDRSWRAKQRRLTRFLK